MKANLVVVERPAQLLATDILEERDFSDALVALDDLWCVCCELLFVARPVTAKRAPATVQCPTRARYRAARPSHTRLRRGARPASQDDLDVHAVPGALGGAPSPGLHLGRPVPARPAATPALPGAAAGRTPLGGTRALQQLRPFRSLLLSMQRRRPARQPGMRGPGGARPGAAGQGRQGRGGGPGAAGGRGGRAGGRGRRAPRGAGAPVVNRGGGSNRAHVAARRT